MTDGRFESRQNGEAALAPEDQALLAELLPRLDDRAGPARRRPQAVLKAMVVRAVLDAVLATPAPVTRQPREDLSAADRAEGRIRRIGSSSGRRALLVLVGASLALFSAGALAAAVMVRVVLTQTPAPAPVRTTRALPAAPVVDAQVVEEEPEEMEESEATEEFEPVVVQLPTVAMVRPPRRTPLRVGALCLEDRRRGGAQATRDASRSLVVRMRSTQSSPQ